MDEYVVDALKYVYFKNKICIESGKIKGLELKQCFLFNKYIDDLADKIKINQIKDFKEVMNYGK